ncbi:MAG: hypothetical protein JO242_23220 [Streptosporangiaceae bacterium]|nr:hypothetical protein [Streptosporangiaceae bacterium]
MSINIESAEWFVHANARLLDRHLLAVLLDDDPVERVLDALRAYRNPDGGFGHALEPDVRCPGSQPASTLRAFEVLADVGKLSHPMVADAETWLATIAEPDGGVTTVLPTAQGHPHAPWMAPSTGSGFLTFALVARLWHAGSSHPWLRRATKWCWAELESTGEVGGYTMKFALDFLDAVPDPRRAAAAVERLRPAIGPDGCIRVPGGTEDEKITPLSLSERPGGPSRSLFTNKQIEADLDRLEQGQEGDGGWDVDWLHWSAGQSVEWRGTATVRALITLHAHGRLDLPRTPLATAGRPPSDRKQR